VTIQLLTGDVRDVLPSLADASVHCVVDNVTTFRYIPGMNNIPIEALAYSAGVIDSDGSIGIRRSTYGMRKRGDRVTPGYWARINVKQVEIEAVSLLRELFGGNLRTEHNTLKNGRPFYAWQVQNQQAVRMLGLLLPYLRIKRAQAENCLTLHVLVDGAKRTKQLGTRELKHWTGKVVTVRTMGHSDDHVAACEALYLKAKQLNSVGMKGVRDDQTIDRGCARSTADAA
jgi:hypothetical protein